ncbi:MAG TPA: hypothetical protein VF092_03600 [Longimicrobium sp.]
MRKLALDVNGIMVESFPTSRADEEVKGTIRAAEGTRTGACGTCVGYTCAGPSCFTSCDPGGPDCTCPPPL